MSDACNIMFSRCIIDSRSINDTSRVIRMMIVSDAPSCGIILTTVEESFMIVIYFYNTGHCSKFRKVNDAEKKV